MSIRARKAGLAVWSHVTDPAGGSGEVLAVYRRSLFWLAGPDQPLTLAWDPALRGPLTLEVDGPISAVAPGDRVTREGSLLCIGPFTAIDVSGAALLDEPLPALGADEASALAAALDRSLRDRPARGDLGDLVRGELGDAWTQAARPLVDFLVAGLEADSGPMVTAATAKLVGLGPGLTPAGDDFLAGMLAALQAAAPSGCPCVALLGDAIARQAEQTTMISRHFLRWAVQRRYGESVRRVFAGSAGAIEGLLAAGATSGADTAAGIWAGLGLVQRRLAA